MNARVGRIGRAEKPLKLTVDVSGKQRSTDRRSKSQPPRVALPSGAGTSLLLGFVSTMVVESRDSKGGQCDSLIGATAWPLNRGRHPIALAPIFMAVS